MACLFIDGFDAYSDDTDIGSKWDSAYSGTADWNLVAGRYGGSAIQMDSASAFMQKVVAAAATLIVGFDYKPSTIIGDDILFLRDSGVVQLSLYQEADGKLSVKRGATTLGTTTQVLSAGTYYHIEFKFTIHNTTGSYYLQIEGIDALNNASVDTMETANATVDEVRIEGPATGSTFDIDNFYVLDTTGAQCNDLLGKVQVQTIYPNGDTADTGFVRSSGANDYEMVDEAAMDSDTTYVSSDVIAAKSLFDYTALTVEASVVHAAQMVGVMRRESAEATPNLALIMKSGTTEGASPNLTMTDTYDYFRYIQELNPDTASAWTPTEVNAMTGGVEVKS